MVLFGYEHGRGLAFYSLLLPSDLVVSRETPSLPKRYPQFIHNAIHGSGIEVFCWGLCGNKPRVSKKHSGQSMLRPAPGRAGRFCLFPTIGDVDDDCMQMPCRCPKGTNFQDV